MKMKGTPLSWLGFVTGVLVIVSAWDGSAAFSRFLPLYGKSNYLGRPNRISMAGCSLPHNNADIAHAHDHRFGRVESQTLCNDKLGVRCNVDRSSSIYRPYSTFVYQLLPNRDRVDRHAAMVLDMADGVRDSLHGLVWIADRCSSRFAANVTVFGQSSQ